MRRRERRSEVVARRDATADDEVVLAVLGLRTVFASRSGRTTAVDGLDYEVRRGQTVAVVGESGSGKSAHAVSVMRLLPRSGRVVAGEVLLGGTDVLRLDDDQLTRIRGSEIGMVFQDPMSSLNPVLTVGRQVTETVQVHEGLNRQAARDRAADLLRRLRLPDADAQLDRYPHQLSGGMRQRVALALAVACRPRVLIADEPTTALDVTVQAQILDLVAGLSAETGMAVVLITHDLGLVARYADRVVVMYAGRAVEDAPVRQLFRSPSHPYTQDLLRSRPSLADDRRHRLPTIAGTTPDMRQIPGGCAYAPRCAHAEDRCRAERPPTEPRGDEWVAACWRAQELHDAAAARGGAPVSGAPAASGGVPNDEVAP